MIKLTNTIYVIIYKRDWRRNEELPFFMMLYLDCLLHPGIYTESSYRPSFNQHMKRNMWKQLLRGLTFFVFFNSFCVRNFFFHNDSMAQSYRISCMQQRASTSPSFPPPVLSHMSVFFLFCFFR